MNVFSGTMKSIDFVQLVRLNFSVHCTKWSFSMHIHKQKNILKLAYSNEILPAGLKIGMMAIKGGLAE